MFFVIGVVVVVVVVGRVLEGCFYNPRIKVFMYEILKITGNQ